MGAELARERAGDKTKTGMNEHQLEDFARKPVVKGEQEVYNIQLPKSEVYDKWQSAPGKTGLFTARRSDTGATQGSFSTKPEADAYAGKMNQYHEPSPVGKQLDANAIMPKIAGAIGGPKAKDAQEKQGNMMNKVGGVMGMPTSKSLIDRIDGFIEKAEHKTREEVIAEINRFRSHAGSTGRGNNERTRARSQGKLHKQEGIKGYGAVTGKVHLAGRQYGEKTIQGKKQRRVSPEAQEKHDEGVERRRDSGLQ
jgi:hypothetical protein